jgi:sec-independent protein translocase protein TatC
MTLREHIIELRNRLVISVIAIVICTIAAWFIYQQAFKFLTDPFFESVRQLNPKPGQTTPTLTMQGVGDALTFHIKVSALIGVVLAGPIWLYQLWAFIAPGLQRSEKLVKPLRSLTENLNQGGETPARRRQTT